MKTQTATLLLALPLCSCASILAEHKPIRLTSSPSGATFQTSDGQTGTTPAVVTPADTGDDLVVTFSLDGHGPATLTADSRISNWVIGNAIFGLLGIVFIAIDAGSSNAYVFEDHELHAILAPLVVTEGSIE